jgi:hypothetical protein
MKNLQDDNTNVIAAISTKVDGLVTKSKMMQGVSVYGQKELYLEDVTLEWQDRKSEKGNMYSVTDIVTESGQLVTFFGPFGKLKVDLDNKKGNVYLRTAVVADSSKPEFPIKKGAGQLSFELAA